MRGMMLLTSLLVPFLTGCTWYEAQKFRSELREAREDALRDIDRAACENAGGKVEGIGIFGIPACVQYYSDGGKPCRDKSECQGLCFRPEVLERGKESDGTCQSSEHDSFGCISRIEDGKVTDSMCQD
jgi:hypothetical protein